MNIIKEVSLISPDNTEETCAEFFIDEEDQAFILYGALIDGRKYTFSCWAKALAAGSITAEGETFEIPTEWHKIEVSFTANSTMLQIKFTPGTYYIYHPMLEVGTKASDWQPSEKDMEYRATQIELSLGGIKTTVEAQGKELGEAKSTAEQTAKKFLWIIKSGDNETNFVLTDRVAKLLSEEFKIDALTKFKNSAENGTETVINGGAIDLDSLFARYIEAKNLHVTEKSTFGPFEIADGRLKGLGKTGEYETALEVFYENIATEHDGSGEEPGTVLSRRSAEISAGTISVKKYFGYDIDEYPSNSPTYGCWITEDGIRFNHPSGLFGDTHTNQYNRRRCIIYTNFKLRDLNEINEVNKILVIDEKENVGYSGISWVDLAVTDGENCTDCNWNCRYNKVLKEVKIRGYVKITPAETLEAGSTIVIGIIDSSAIPDTLQAMSAYRNYKATAHWSGAVNTSGEIIIRCSSELTAGYSYGIYINGSYYKEF